VVGGAHRSRTGAPGANAAAAWRAVLAAAGHDMPPNLVFAGPDHRTHGFLGRFAAFYMVSDAQGCPNASLEAMAAGLPVVANPDGGTPEQVEHGVTGLLVPETGGSADFADALACALARILGDPPRARAMGAAARAKAAAFSMTAMADAYAAALGLDASSPERT
jgi:glycosyltransferase involved in cell wall biosynthesis